MSAVEELKRLRPGSSDQQFSLNTNQPACSPQTIPVHHHSVYFNIQLSGSGEHWGIPFCLWLSYLSTFYKTVPRSKTLVTSVGGVGTQRTTIPQVTHSPKATQQEHCGGNTTPAGRENSKQGHPSTNPKPGQENRNLLGNGTHEFSIASLRILNPLHTFSLAALICCACVCQFRCGNHLQSNSRYGAGGF